MMHSFEGQYRRAPTQSLRGASKKEEKEALLKRNQEAREKREDYRKKTENAIKIQKVYRGYRVRQKQNKDLREDFDNYLLKISRDKLAVREVMNLSTQLCHFYRDKEDGSRLVWLSQQLIMKKEEYVTVVLSEPSIGQQQIKNMLALCLRYLTTIGNTSQPVAIPLRMLEVFTSSASYSKPDVLCGIWKFLIDNGYFDCMRLLLNAKVPSSLEKSSTPPTPVSATLYELIMVPISYAANCKDKSFSHHVLRMVCKSLLCPVYTEQISQFLLPAMAYGKYPFPFVDLIHALIYHCKLQEVGEGKNKGYGRTSDRLVLKLESTPWLLGAFLALGEKYVESLKIDTFSVYLQVVQRLFILLPARKHEDEEDSESEDDMDIEEENLVKDRLAELRDQCLRILDSQVHVQKSIALVTSHPDDNDVINALSVICHNLMSQHRHSIHRKRLLYTLAYNSRFIRSLWRCCVSLSTISATKTETPLVIMLCRGLSMSERDVNRIVPVLSTFCSMFNHSLLTLHDVEFYGDSSVKSSSMPFSLDELVNMMITLRDVCLGIVELAHPDAKPTVNEDYRIALNRTGGKTRNNNVKDTTKETAQWSYLFKVTAALVRQAYTRDARRSFCPKDLWLSDRVKIQADGPSQVYRAQDSMFRRRPFRTMQTFLGINRFDDEGGPPLSNKDMKNSVILTELPFVVPFQERVKMLQKLIQTDKEGRQEDIDFGHFGHGHNIHVMIRRNFIYEDAFDKLSKANEPDLKKKMRVQLVNAAGLDEAGIDGGGIFREFLTVLLKASFDPNRGFFSQTTDRVLYPNPQSSVLVENYRDHYFFIGRMLGKAIYENMLVELPFAAFFLSKILSRTSGDLDIHHLASLDPDLYKNLLFLKHYDGDVAELELDFTAVNNEFGETKVEELKPGGRNIEVTNANRIEYIHLMADYKLNKQIRTHTMSFREGLSDLINLEWLRMFDQHELQVLISGSSVPINIEDLKQHTNYSGGYTADHPVITMFWDIVERFSDEQRGQLLKFITSCSRPPLLGFKDLYPALCIHYGGNEAERLPTASTCMNLLKLPECLDETTLKQKLLYAIESGAGFELS